jgi:tuftelin-interacting protein 11
LVPTASSLILGVHILQSCVMSDSEEGLHDASSDDGMEKLPKLHRASWNSGSEMDDEPTTRRRRTKDEATYGIFMDDSGDDEKGARGHKSRKRSNREQSHKKTINCEHGPPMFISGKSEDPAPFPPTVSNETQTKTVLKSQKGTPEKGSETLAFIQTAEEQKLQAQREAADQEFQKLLLLARAKKGITRLQNRIDSEVPAAGLEPSERDPNTFFTGDDRPTGLGFGKRERVSKPPPKRDPNLGAWEKHTKGIGMKLLSKMGYSGSGGLGSKKRKRDSSLSRPVEVKVRPANLGLGFGGFKEATKLKSIQKTGVEANGVEFSENMGTVRLDMQSSSIPSNAQTSLLPSTNDLLKEQSWRKVGRGATKNKFKQKTVPYEDILQKINTGPAVILDLRGPGAAKTTDSGLPKDLQLADELLYNMTLLRNTYENKLYSSLHFVDSTKRKLESLQSDIQSIDERRSLANDRADKLIRLVDLLKEMQILFEDGIDRNESQIQGLILEIDAIFTVEEKESLQILNLILPSLVGDLVSSKMEHWHPLRDETKSAANMIRSLLSISGLANSNSTHLQSENTALQKIVLINYIIPRVQKSFQSPQWDPARDTEIALRFYETFQSILMDTFIIEDQENYNKPGKGSDDQVFPMIHVDKGAAVIDLIRDKLIYDSVYPKLMRSINAWKPLLHDDRLANPLDRFVLPWVPLLDHRSLLPTLVSDCKKKLRNGLSFMQKQLSDDLQFAKASMELLSPWTGVLKVESLQSMVSHLVAPRLGSYIRNSTIERGPDRPSNLALKVVNKLNCTGLLANLESLTLVEELLVRWSQSMHQWLEGASHTERQDLIKTYLVWRNGILFPVPSDGKNIFDASCYLFRRDETLCRIFFSIASMFKTAKDERFAEFYPPAVNYRTALARRVVEDRRKAADDLTRLENNGDISIDTRVRLNRKGLVPTFRDVVEQYATERGILFQPRMGHGSKKDGKQVFLFGDAPIYMDANVIYVFASGDWRPISLGDLEAKITGSA